MMKRSLAALCATLCTGLLAVTAPAAAGTLKMTFEAAGGKTQSDGSVLASPIITLGFANDVDYAALTNPNAGPKFGAADLAFIEFTRIENIAFIEQNPAFENPPLTQAVFDTMTEVFSREGAFPQGPGIFQPVDGSISSRSILFFSEDLTGPFATTKSFSLTSRGNNILRPGGNWDSDQFSDAAPWNLARTSIEWNASATEFAAVPLPASLPLVLAGLGALGWVGRRRA